MFITYLYVIDFSPIFFLIPFSPKAKPGPRLSFLCLKCIETHKGKNSDKKTFSSQIQGQQGSSSISAFKEDEEKKQATM